MAFTPPTGAQIINAGSSTNYYVSTSNGTTTITTTTGAVLATSTNKGQTYTFTSTGNTATNLKQALSNPQSPTSKTVQQNAGKPAANVAQNAPTAPELPGPGAPVTSPNADPTPSQSIAGSFPGGLRYPEDIASSKQDRIKFQACELFARTGPNGEGSLTKGFIWTWAGPNAQPISGEVAFIGIQAPISDQNSVEWGADSVNALDTALYNASYNLMKENDASAQVTEFFQNIIKSAGDYQGRIQRLFAGQAASINNILARTDNVILNPNLELLFNGPQLRPFSFQFKMSARSQSEALIIKRIIKFFKYHMAVRTEKGTFLKAPHVFQIEYQYNESLHPGINKIKTCALTNFSVDYSPLGTYMTYGDGTMVSYLLSMQFQELTPIYDTDYGNNDQIGY